MTNYNQTLIKAFDCPRRGNLLREHLSKHGLTPSDGPGLVGQAVHRFIADYLAHLHKNGLEGDPAYLDRLNKIAAGFPISLDTNDFEYLCSQVVKWFAHDLERMPEFEDIHIEEGLRFHVSNDIYLTGRPDYWIDHGEFGGVVDVWDWKTSRRLWTQSETEDGIQLKFYALLISKSIDWDPAGYNLAYYFPRHQAVREFYFSKDELEYFEEYIIEKVNKIDQRTRFYEVPLVKNCEWCEFSIDCPASKSGLITHIEDEQDAISHMGKMIAYKSAHKARQKLLKEYVEDNGPITVGGEVLDYHPRKPSFDLFNMPGIVQTLKDHGVDMDEIKNAGVSATALKSLCKKYGDLYDTICKEHGKVKKGTTFTAK